MEDYKKMYEDLLERIKQMANAQPEVTKAAIESQFPELKESEDERIRKAIIQFFELQDDNTTYSLIPKKDIIAWLEKKGEQKPQGKSALEAIKEEKVDNANKVEPKFKVGDWVVSPNGVYWHIDAIRDGRYQVSSDSGKSADWPLDTNIYHEFTIEDAKDGDVLELDCGIGIFKDKFIDGYNIHCYCYYSNEGVLEINKDSLYDTYQSQPATKEQRDTLERAITNAGYEWDAEKKELKNITQNPVSEMKTPEESLGVDSYTYNKIVDECVYGEQNPAWSEDDDANLVRALAFIKNTSLKDVDEIKESVLTWITSLKDKCLPQPKQEWSEEDKDLIEEIISHYRHLIAIGSLDSERYKSYIIPKLKSIKPQSHWKPSDEQMSALNYVINLMASSESVLENDYYYNVFKDLRKQLKKLKEE